jgi:hypothetical protein
MSLGWLPSTLIAATLVLIGWRVLYNNAKKIASRNETFAITNRITVLLTEIQNNSEDFWLKGAFKEQPQYYELLILSKIKQISAKLKLLENRKINTYELNRLIFPIRRDCTMTAPIAVNLKDEEKREQLEAILDSTLKLENQLDITMQQTFPPNF